MPLKGTIVCLRGIQGIQNQTKAWALRHSTIKHFGRGCKFTMDNLKFLYVRCEKNHLRAVCEPPPLWFTLSSLFHPFLGFCLFKFFCQLVRGSMGRRCSVHLYNVSKSSNIICKLCFHAIQIPFDFDLPMSLNQYARVHIIKCWTQIQIATKNMGGCDLWIFWWWIEYLMEHKRH